MSRLFLALLLGFVVAVTGCSSRTPGRAIFADAPSAAPANSTVRNSLGISGLLADPCTGLTPVQLAKYASCVGKGHPNRDSGFTMCVWHTHDPDFAAVTLSVWPDVHGPGELSARNSWRPFAEQVTVDGYPAMHVSGLANGPRTGMCQTPVVVSHRAAVSVDVSTVNPSAPNYVNICTIADKLAHDVITTLKSPI